MPKLRLRHHELLIARGNRFRDVAMCCWASSTWRFGGLWRLHLQGQEVQKERLALSMKELRLELLAQRLATAFQSVLYISKQRL